MPMLLSPDFEFRWTQNLNSIPEKQWQQLAQPLKTPFFDWHWLNNMELCHMLNAETGWQPQHLTLWQQERLVAAAPLYVKQHSQGEFVHDYIWAETAAHFGKQYYPKLLGMSPFSPTIGYQFLIDEGQDTQNICQILLAEIHQFCQQQGLAGCHFLFVDPKFSEQMQNLGMQTWQHLSFVWHNKNFSTFEDYLQSLNAKRRHNIRRERAKIKNNNIYCRAITKEALTTEKLARMYKFYAGNCQKFLWWGSHYLNQPFFESLVEHFADQVLLVEAVEKGKEDVPLAMAFFLYKAGQLYGRYWGAQQDLEYLHFETAYYYPIEWCIQNQIQTFDAGSGNGTHKKRRGFPFCINHSLHTFYDADFLAFFKKNLKKLNQYTLAEANSMT